MLPAQTAADETVSLPYGIDGCKKLEEFPLEDIGFCTQAKCFRDDFGGIFQAQEDDVRVWGNAPQPLSNAEAAQLGEVDVEDHKIWLKLSRTLDRFFAVRGFANDEQFGPQSYQFSQDSTEGRCVFRQHDANDCWLAEVLQIQGSS